MVIAEYGHNADMIIGVTGAAGFIGRQFSAAAQLAGHEIVPFSRSSKSGWRVLSEMNFSGLDALVHLAGEPILGLWTPAKKRDIYRSRVEVTQHIIAALKQLPTPPKIIISASGISYYGNRGDELLDERSAMGQGFLAEVVRDWEGAVAEANGFARTCSLRMGMVLGSESRPWRFQRRIFSLGLGGRFGPGTQWMPWIHVDDAVSLILFALDRAHLQGSVVAVAPGAVTNTQYTSELARLVRRPALIPTPAFLLKCLPGGMGAFFLDSIRASPTAALNAGFKFSFPSLTLAFEKSLEK